MLWANLQFRGLTIVGMVDVDIIKQYGNSRCDIGRAPDTHQNNPQTPSSIACNMAPNKNEHYALGAHNYDLVIIKGSNSVHTTLCFVYHNPKLLSVFYFVCLLSVWIVLKEL